MRLLHILDHSIPLHSGYSFRTIALLTEQRKLGWETFHVTSSKHYASTDMEEYVNGFHFFRTPSMNSLMTKMPIFNQLTVIASLRRRILEIVEQVKPNILHAHSPSLNGIAAISVGKIKRLPVVYEVRALWEDGAVSHGTGTEGGLRYRATRAIETYVLRNATAVTTICEGLRKEIMSRNIPGNKITVIPNAVDVQRFATDSTPDHGLLQKLGVTEKRIIGFIGSFYRYEGLSVLLKAVPLLMKSVPSLCVLLIGGGPEEYSLKQQVRTAGLENEVIFTGRVPHEQIEAYYGILELLIYPRLATRVTELVTPLKPLEAMAKGKLLLASNVGGHRELIEHGTTGFLFHAGDANSLAETAIGLLHSPERGDPVRKQARQYVEEKRTWSLSAAGYRDVYEKAMNHKSCTNELPIT